MKNRIKDFFKVFSLLYVLAPAYGIGLSLIRLLTIMVPMVRLITITNLVNKIQSSTNLENMIPILWKPIVLLLCVEFVNGIAGTLYQDIEKKCRLYLNQTQFPVLINKIAKMEYDSFENSEKLDLIERVKKNYVSKITSAFTTTLIFVETIITAFFIVIVLSTQVGVWGFLFLFVSIPLIVAGQKSGSELYEGEVELEKHQRYLDYVEGIYTKRETACEREIFQFGSKIDNLWNKVYANAESSNKKVKIKIYTRMCLSNCLTFSGYAAAISLICVLFIGGKVTYGIFVSLIITILKLMYTLSYSLSWDIAEMGRVKAFSEDYANFLKLPEIEGATENVIISDNFVFDKLEFKNVYFKYPNSAKPILNDLSFIIEKGNKYAFVGENGAGKTTVTKLLLRLYEPDSGEIMLNDIPIKNYSYGQLKGLFSVVFQDFTNYELKIRDSITLGGKIPGDEELAEVLKFVGFDSLIENDSEFLEKELGKLSKESIEFSGGQWQRLAIARAVLSNHNILILDEATASIDPIQEREIYKLFDKTSTDRTTLFITHRLGSTKFADIIYVIKEGKISESGNHEELMVHNGIYAEMYTSQSRWYQ